MKAVDPEIFRMKQFEIDQTGAAMKVNTDGLCLAGWAELDGNGTILDIGSGTGLIALVMAQRYPQARITGIEPHVPSFECMQRNFEQSPWRDRLSAAAHGLEQFTDSLPSGTLDGIVSNPPYFSNAYPPVSDSRLQSRHMRTLTIAQLAECTARLLSPAGNLSVIYPPEQMRLLTAACANHGMHPARRCAVYSGIGAKPVRIMQAFASGQAGAIKEETLVIYNPDNTYSEAYRALLKDLLIIF